MRRQFSEDMGSRRPSRTCLAAGFALVAATAVGCGEIVNGSADPTEKEEIGDRRGQSSTPTDSSVIVFKDEVKSNSTVPPGLDGLLFVDTKGKRVALKEYIGSKNLILVFTEGFSGMLCPFCKTQTSRLIANYDKFKERDTEILVVYPGARDHLDEFLVAARTSGKRQIDQVPFPIVLDETMQAVDFFDIRSNLAHPSTYIIDKRGDVKLAYVGADMTADRPSISALLKTLDAANEDSR